jgi:hypothetical protein
MFQTAVERGFRVHALPFADGLYVDAGTVDGLAAARLAVASVDSAAAGT